MVLAISTFQQMQEDVAIMENLEFTDQEKSDLRLGYQSGSSGLYCQQCEECLGPFVH
jgi:hypothetical protein